MVMTMKRRNKTVLALVMRMLFLSGLVARIVVREDRFGYFSVLAFELRVEMFSSTLRTGAYPNEEAVVGSAAVRTRRLLNCEMLF